jgi:hypothetical protein
MLTGIVEKRSIPGTPNVFELLIILDFPGEEYAVKIHEIGSAKFKFAIPLKNGLENEGPIELSINLPIFGKVIIKGRFELLHHKMDANLERISFYQIQLNDVSTEVWNYIVDFCKLDQPTAKLPHQLADRKDMRVCANLIQSKLQINDESPFDIIIEDISYGGAKISSPRLIPLKSNVTLLLTYREISFELNGTCIWISANETNGHEFHAGILFEDLNLEKYNLIRKLLFQHA